MTVDEAKYSERDANFQGPIRRGPAYRESLLDPGHRISGPAFVDGGNATVVLPPTATSR